MTKQLCLYSNRVFLGNELIPASIVINKDLITGVFPHQKLEDPIDFSPSVIMPGVIDAHVHINEPGNTHWEGFDTATKAAARGGTTTLVDMPLNSLPVVTTVQAFQKKLEAAKNKLHVNVGFWAGVTDQNFEEVQALFAAGCLGVKVFLSNSGLDEFPNISLEDLEVVMQNISSGKEPILAHCELDSLPAEDLLKNNPRSYDAYLRSRPKAWENEAVKAFISLSEKYNCSAHIVHLASDEILPWIIHKKNKGVPFTVETCSHYLYFAAEKIKEGATLFKCAPPIRDLATQAALLQAIFEGTIDFITTDHSPAPPEMKELDSGDFSKAWGGISGLQFLLSASWTALKPHISLEDFIPLLTSKPAAFLNLSDQIGQLAPGYRADLTIWNPEQTFEVTESIIEHRHKITPYLEEHLNGVVTHTFVNGKPVYENGAFINLNQGRTIQQLEEKNTG